MQNKQDEEHHHARGSQFDFSSHGGNVLFEAAKSNCY